MLEDVGANVGYFFLLLVFMWTIQFVFAYKQMKGFNARVGVLRQGGLTAVGLGGDRYRGRNYAVLTADEDNIIVHAEQFGGWTTFSKLRPVPDLLGRSLQDLLDNQSTLPVPKKLQVAFGNAARDILEAREGVQENEQLQPA